MSLGRPLSIFVPHCSDLLTDHRPHGDGLIAYGFIRHLADRGHNLYVAAQEVDLRDPLPSNVRIFPISPRSKNHSLSRLVYMSRVRQLFTALRRQVNFDIVHQMNPVYTGVSLSLLWMGIPVVLGTYVARWPDPRGESGGRTLGSKAASAFRTCAAALQQSMASRILLTAPAAANRLAPLGPLRPPYSYLAHGIDTELFSPGGGDEDENSLSVLYLAHVSKKKGIFDLLSAFVDVAYSFPNCILYVAGSGPETPAAQDWAERLGLQKHVTFLGQVERLSAPEMYRNCSIYCLPSHGEPYATTVIEAMSCGKPIVFTNAGGLPHMVGAEGGIGVGVGDAKDLSRALCCLLANPARRKAMGEQNRRRVLETMTWDRVIDRLEGIYAATIESGRRASGGDLASAPTRAPSGEELCPEVRSTYVSAD
jgi:glycosyltransferase involved in cell wall biosynthesis